MKQYEAFFRAAPEAFIQITFRIVHWSNRNHWDYEGKVNVKLVRWQENLEPPYVNGLKQPDID